MNKTHIDIDPINNLLYVRLCEGKVYKTIEHENGDILVDLNRNGKILGIEFLNLNIPRGKLHTIAQKYHNPSIDKIHPNEALKVYA